VIKANKKQIFSLVMAMMMLFSSLPVNVMARISEESGYIYEDSMTSQESTETGALAPETESNETGTGTETETELESSETESEVGSLPDLGLGGSGVRFTRYPPGNNGWETNYTPSSGSTHHFGVEFEVVASGVSLVVFHWYRNGELFATTDNSNLSPAHRTGLTLRDVNSDEHDGRWTLVAYSYVNGVRTFRDEVSRPSHINVRNYVWNF